MKQTPAIINGQIVETSSTIPVYDPSTGEVFAESADCQAKEVGEAVKAARRAHHSWSRTTVTERSRLLRKLSVLILSDIEGLAELESRQTGKPLRQARRDVEITVRYFDFYASAVETFYGIAFNLDESTNVQTIMQSHGVTAHIVPWNYPLSILARSVAPALATGNCSVLKPAEEAPLTACRIVELAIEAGFPPGTINVVPGYGETAGATLSSHPGVNHISFTGSVEVGRIISHAAAENLIPVTMELGGKSPNIVFADADLDRAVPVIVNSILQMAGQTCSAGSRLLVDAAIHVPLTERIREAFTRVDIGPALADPTLGPLITAEHRDRIIKMISDSNSILFGGKALQGGTLGDGYFFEPTLIDNVDPAGPLGQEELFGPVLAVTEFNGIDEAITLANGTDYGLVAGVWTTNVSTAQRLIRETIAGQVFVNTYGASGGVELPFGGFKNSGFGREKGAEGLRSFVQVKTAVIAT